MRRRLFDEAEYVDYADNMLSRKGSNKDIIDPIDTLIHNAVNTIRAAEKNKTKLKMLNLARCKGFGKESYSRRARGLYLQRKRRNKSDILNQGSF